MVGEPAFRVATDTHNGITRLAMSGELDMNTVERLDDALANCLSDGATAVVLDLRDLTFMDSTGLYSFLRARSRSLSNGHRLLFVGATRPVRMVFELAGMDSVLDEHEAVTTLDQFTRDGDGYGREMPANSGDPHG